MQVGSAWKTYNMEEKKQITVYDFIELIEAEILLFDRFDPTKINLLDLARKCFVLANQFAEQQNPKITPAKIHPDTQINPFNDAGAD